MVETLIGLIIIVLIAYLILPISMHEGDGKNLPWIYLYGLFMLIFGAILAVYVIDEMIEKDKPKAIDVYRGNTTLEITYRDSIPLDTTVVFKAK